MAIVIYTYSNPYRLHKEPYWALIKNGFHLCASQTLASGLCDQYSDFFEGKLTTITRFVNKLHDQWESPVTEINQRATVDNLIEYISFNEILDESIDIDDVRLSLKRNRAYVVKSIRIMFELDMNPDHIQDAALTYEQKCVVEIYRELRKNGNKHFLIKNDFTNEEINSAISETMEEALRKEIYRDKLEGVKRDIIVIHGIHQFSPIMLKTIELLSKYKNVFILFNYVPDYKNVYQTWLNVYSWFESKIILSPHNFYDHSKEFEGSRIADNIAAMIAGSTATIDYSERIEVTEFDNQTEFAGYIAKKFEKAEVERAKHNYAGSSLYYMDEQIYAANSNVNDILKIYFPEQFGERNFLDYPIGHFFIAITNLWDDETKGMNIKNIEDIYECLSCGIIAEANIGQAVSIFDKCKLYFQDEKTIKRINRKLKELKERIEELDSGSAEMEELSRIEYFDVAPDEIDELITALTALNEIAETFFMDFSDQKNDFKVFYDKVSDVLVKEVLSKEDIDSEFREIVQRVLERLKEVQGVEAKASFDCLRETMQIYLQQVPAEGKGAYWIARNFEQIDGDILRKNYKEQDVVYHFACLSDCDMSITHGDEFSWPLDMDFFEVAQAPVDWKYQVYVTSRMEYKNFRRYALVYGLAFSKCKIKLSYIKNAPDHENEMYYLLKVLNANPVPYSLDDPNTWKKNDRYIKVKDSIYRKFSQYDLMKYRLCRYRFLLETIIEGKSVYKDDFLLKRYLIVLLEHRTRKEFSGKTYVKSMVRNYLIEQMDELAYDFPFLNRSEKVDVINMAENYIEQHAVFCGKFTNIKAGEVDYMVKRENFLSLPNSKTADIAFREVFKNATQAEVDSVLSEENLEQDKYRRSRNSLCDKCADKDICLEVFRSIRK
ncbi:MAG: hypothetical protein NC541_01675 [bacterium]|nr:hypothetical protein [bacterium]